MHVCMYVCIKVHVCRRPRVYVHMYVCINCMCSDSLIVVYYVYMYVCIHVWIGGAIIVRLPLESCPTPTSSDLLKEARKTDSPCGGRLDFLLNIL